MFPTPPTRQRINGAGPPAKGFDGGRRASRLGAAHRRVAKPRDSPIVVASQTSVVEGAQVGAPIPVAKSENHSWEGCSDVTIIAERCGHK